MFEKVLDLFATDKQRQVAYLVGGMGSLLVGNKIGGLSLFAKGALGLEKHWNDAHPEHKASGGGLVQRWNRAIHFYESTHMNDTNRKLHIVGIPLVVGGAAGLLLFVPFGPRWWVSAGAFTGGWALNIVGHSVFEGNAPAFADDPLSFIAGPVWDLQQVFGKNAKVSRTQVHTDDGNVTVINVEPAVPAVA